MTHKETMAHGSPARQLHDRATRGEALTQEEQTILNTWYKQQDEAESLLLGASPVSSPSMLQTQVDAALARLHTVTQRIQTLAKENAAIRREIAALARQLTQTPKRTA